MPIRKRSVQQLELKVPATAGRKVLSSSRLPIQLGSRPVQDVLARKVQSTYIDIGEPVPVLSS